MPLVSLLDRIDTDGNGEISIDECRVFLTSQRGYTPAAADAIFETLDLNSDGAISKLEWEDGRLISSTDERGNEVLDAALLQQHEASQPTRLLLHHQLSEGQLRPGLLGLHQGCADPRRVCRALPWLRSLRLRQLREAAR